MLKTRRRSKILAPSTRRLKYRVIGVCTNSREVRTSLQIPDDQSAAVWARTMQTPHSRSDCKRFGRIFSLLTGQAQANLTWRLTD